MKRTQTAKGNTSSLMWFPRPWVAHSWPCSTAIGQCSVGRCSRIHTMLFAPCRRIIHHTSTRVRHNSGTISRRSSNINHSSGIQHRNGNQGKGNNAKPNVGTIRSRFGSSSVMVNANSKHATGDGVAVYKFQVDNAKAKMKFVNWGPERLATDYPYADGTWVATRQPNGFWTLGCLACANMASPTGVYAKFLACDRDTVSTYLLRLHQQSSMHQKSVAGDACCSSPTAKEFKSLIAISKKHANTYVFGRHKTKAMLWCIAERQMDIERALVAEAEHCCLSQDARLALLLCRLSVSSSKLDKINFAVGSRRIDGTDAFAIRNKTEEVVDRWCTPRTDRPQYGGPTPVPPPKLMSGLKRKLCTTTSAVATDAASDEFRAVRLMSGASKSRYVDLAIFPNLIIRAKDPTHASTRFLKTWNNEEFLDNVFLLWEWGRKPSTILCRTRPTSRGHQGHVLIHNRLFAQFVLACLTFLFPSHLCVPAMRFNIFCNNAEGIALNGERVRNMNFVKPRFNNAQQHMGRVALWIDAVIALCDELCAVRAGDDPAKVAQHFLDNINEEVYIQGCMMSDAGDDNMFITRFFDQGDTHQLAAMPTSIHKYIASIDFLFVEGGCTQTGYTEFGLEQMQRQRTFWFGVHANALGGPGRVDHAMVQRCLARMCNWVRLAITCIEFEFPQWHTLYCFAIFDESANRGQHGLADDFEEAAFARLAMAISVSTEELKAEYMGHVAFATASYLENESRGVVAAWVDAIRRPNGASAPKLRLPKGNALRTVLHAFQAWDGMTSSGVEQSFSKHARVIGKHHTQLSDGNANSASKTILDISNAGEKHIDKVVSGAQKIWRGNWTRARSSGAATRKNFSAARRGSTNDKVTDEASFKRKRRRAVEDAATKNAHAKRSRVEVLTDATAKWGPPLGAEVSACLRQVEAAQRGRCCLRCLGRFPAVRLRDRHRACCRGQARARCTRPRGRPQTGSCRGEVSSSEGVGLHGLECVLRTRDVPR